MRSTKRTASRRVKELRGAIARLNADKPVVAEGVWYETQKEHWLGWLREYAGPGAYGRTGRGYDAKFADNHIVFSPMLDWLARASGVVPRLIRKARVAQKATRSGYWGRQSAAFRQVVTWEVISEALWGPQESASSGRAAKARR